MREAQTRESVCVREVVLPSISESTRHPAIADAFGA